ncbi:AraC family transcriptional regulator [Nostoc sp. TCL26-01]|uniref:helix-turn-helix transcriptional regulator n=1 Tax=Nostoc sp. TCL26-01 TaxID=2576904 RepID=UPI0015BB8D58|nr:AraC family transcriptional regulator [Nostoc sp. TCL26-01]QLE57677.1 helix-turn-helix transcriptional regulator [Nostoc sp. TCL26-01]
MTVSVSQQAYADLVKEAQHQGEVLYQQTGAEKTYRLPKYFGRGVDCITELRHGLTIHIREAQLRQPLRLERQHEATFPLTAKFYLSSCSRVKTPGAVEINDDYEESHGYNYLYCLPNVLEYEEWRAEEPIQLVMLYADIDYFRLFSPNDESLPATLAQMIETGTPTQFYQSLGQNTIAMQQILQQILHCPYQGIPRQMYLEAKALELLTLQFTQWTQNPEPSLKTKLRKDDIERLYAAKDILINRINNPPSLLELSRQIGLNERKLKQGFRQIFGTTVFGYLQDYRLQQAQDLLKKRDISIARVATTVGYTNPEAFSVAFRRKFAISPKAYQMQRNHR